jgi:NAD(P)H-hydrate epimerase
MAGAAYLSAKAAYRSGAGLVEIFTHEANRTVLQTSLPEAIVTSYSDAYTESAVIPSLERADCIVIGCGLGTGDLSKKIVSDTLRLTDTKKTPLVIDADALNVISRSAVLLKYASRAIITPHPMEFSRLSGLSVEDILNGTVSAAKDLAKKHSLICLLKDHETVVSDGERVYINKTGNSGMATGGSGDVLAGILGGILAQTKGKAADTTKLVALGAYIHGRCGDIAASELGEYSLMASDIIDALPKVLKNK